MAAGERFVQTTNGQDREDPGEEDDDDWSDFTSDSNSVSTSTHFIDQSEERVLPSRDDVWVFDSVSETARLCFPVPTFSGLLNGESSITNLEETPALLEENQFFPGYFPQPVWKGSNFESALIKSLDLATLEKGEDQETELAIERIPGLFNFHRLAERDIETSSPRWGLVQMEEPLCIQKSKESVYNENSEANLNEFTGDLEIWTDFDGADSDEFFLLVGRQQSEDVTGLEDGHAASGLHQLAFEELRDLRDEMATYVKEYSDVLVEELIVKDEQLREKDIKNSFISSLLTLQSKVRDVQTGQGKKKSGPSVNKYLTTVIPYMEILGGPDNKCLEKLIEIMDAMKCDSPTVPGILTEYILKVLCP